MAKTGKIVGGSVDALVNALEEIGALISTVTARRNSEAGLSCNKGRSGESKKQSLAKLSISLRKYAPDHF